MWRREMETVSFESAGTSKSLAGGATTKASPTDSMELHKATLNNVCMELMNPRTACPLPDCQEDYTTREVDETEPKLHVQQKILGRLQPDWVELEASIPSDRCTYVYVDGENLFATALTKCKNIHGYRDLFDILASFATRLINHMIADDGPNRLALQRPPISPTVDSTTFYVVYVKWPGSPMVRQLYESASGQGVLIGALVYLLVLAGAVARRRTFAHTSVFAISGDDFKWAEGVCNFCIPPPRRPPYWFNR